MRAANAGELVGRIMEDAFVAMVPVHGLPGLGECLAGKRIVR
jgi:hypothetical protein